MAAVDVVVPFKICQGKLKLHGKIFEAEIDYREIKLCVMNSIIEKSSFVQKIS